MNLKAGINKVNFQSLGDNLIGNLYTPYDFDKEKSYPAIIVAGPLATVKEQAAGLYASKLTNEGFITLAFDFRTQGESAGEPRNYDNPFNKGEDIQQAISFLSSLENVDQDRVGNLGICAGASYTIHGIVTDKRSKAFASVGAFFSLREFSGYNPLITEEIRNFLLSQSNTSRQQYYETGIADCVYILYPESIEQLPLSPEDAADVNDYYYKRVEKCWPNFSKKMTAMTYESHLKSHVLDNAKDLSIPYLGIVGSKAFTRPYTDRFIAEILHDNKEIYIIEGARHVQSYDKEIYVDQAVNLLSSFYQKYL